MKPYYERAGVSLYHGDCREVLPALCLPAPLCVVSDQPYGTGWVRGGGKVGEFAGEHEKPAWDTWDDSWLALVKPQPNCWALFCPDSAVSLLARALGRVYRLRYYVKTNPRPPLCGNDTPSVEPIFVSPRVRFGTGPAHFLAYNGDSPLHPCQKPEQLMRWLVEGVAAPDETVLDPFAGSGTTLLACAQLGRQSVGIEAEERYCETIARRLDGLTDGVRPGERALGQVALFGGVP